MRTVRVAAVQLSPVLYSLMSTVGHPDMNRVHTAMGDARTAAKIESLLGTAAGEGVA
jgi:hypothetical protein